MSEIATKVKKVYDVQYYVVMNHEEQYSIWPTYKPIPLGWKSVGKAKNKEECLKYIDETWTDMRPLSLRKKMVEMEKEAKKNDCKNIHDCEVIEAKNTKVAAIEKKV
jgi:MbtH protein